MLDRYSRNAPAYDSEVELAEKAMWMGRLRRRLAQQASGDVLEVSVGTGRNARYYDLKRCRSVTMLDQSGEMVEVARGKFRGMYCRSSEVWGGFVPLRSLMEDLMT